MRSLIFIMTVFFSIFIFYKKEFLLKFVENSFNKKISKIYIKNIENLDSKIILDSIYLKEGDYFWRFNPEKLKKDFEKINEIQHYNFVLKENGILHISIVEKKPYMVWTFSNKRKFIDNEGNILRLSGFEPNKLIKISGYINKKQFSILNSVLKKKKQFKSSIKNIYYNENTGWELILHDNTCVILPEKKLDDVLNFFESKIKNSEIYYDYRFYDMRVLERIYLNKKNKCSSF
ncbi:MAG: hypothetical protein CMP38_03105 [Rickettsiales bacterium]|nr:hypothetical protein [Rickettsiales bacterium]